MEQIIKFMRKVTALHAKLICLTIKFYQCAISPFNYQCCRFYPSCSQYALLSIQNHGVCKGLWQTGWRLLRCNPWANGGYDPVLPTKEKC